MAMLTVAHLAVLIKYHWDFRLFQAQASPDEQALMQVDWAAAAELLQDLKRYHHNLVSKEYAQTILTDLRRMCSDEETAQTLLGYASTL